MHIIFQRFSGNVNSNTMPLVGWNLSPAMSCKNRPWEQRTLKGYLQTGVNPKVGQRHLLLLCRHQNLWPYLPYLLFLPNLQIPLYSGLKIYAWSSVPLVTVKNNYTCILHEVAHKVINCVSHLRFGEYRAEVVDICEIFNSSPGSGGDPG